LAVPTPAIAQEAATPAATREIEYFLPYPGILPDSPIYFLKVLRDRVMTWFIRDQRQKAFYLLHLADKRLAAGQTLINYQKKTLGVETIVKGEEYFGQAVDQAFAARAKGQDTSELFAKLTVSAAKHTEVIEGLLTKVTGEDLQRLSKARLENEKLRNRVREIFFRAMGL
jgi:hypothetical protein